MTDHVVVGVTGHRRINDTPSLREAIRGALAATVDGTNNSPITVVSSLAEGADRFVAEEALAMPGARLEAVLPFEPSEYERDFRTRASKREFHRLLSQADATTTVATPGSREEAYEAAGRAVVDRYDVVIAVWDGRASRGRGGTADMVRYARDRGVDVVWIRSSPPHRAVRVTTGT